MENLANAAAPMVTIISNNFWFFILVIACICTKENRLAGLLMLTSFITFGYHTWIVVVIMLITMFTHYLNPWKYYENRFNSHVAQFQDVLEKNGMWPWKK